MPWHVAKVIYGATIAHLTNQLALPPQTHTHTQKHTPTHTHTHTNTHTHTHTHTHTRTHTQQEIVFKKDKATLHVISKKCEDSKLFQINLKKDPLTF